MRFLLVMFLIINSGVIYANDNPKYFNPCLEKEVFLKENKKKEIYEYASLLDKDIELHIIMNLDRDGSPCLIDKYSSYIKYNNEYKVLNNFLSNVDYIQSFNIVKNKNGFVIFVEYGNNYLNQDEYYFEGINGGLFLTESQSRQLRLESQPSKYIKVVFPLNEKYKIENIKLSDYMVNY